MQMNQMKQMNKIIKSAILASSLLFITGCSTKTIDINTVEKERTKLNLSEPNAIKLKDVNFLIITEQNSNTVFKQLETSNKDKVLIGLSDEDYIKMSENLLELKHYIIEQRKIINSYKEYYEPN
jgi:hypothetical protein